MKTLTSLIILATTLCLQWGCTTTKPIEKKAQPIKKAETPKLYNANSPAGKQVTWVLDLLNNKKGVASKEDLKKHFNVKFLTAVPVSQLQQISKGMSEQHAPLVPTKVEAESEHAMAVHLNSKGKPLLIMSIGVDKEAPNKIAGLLFRPAPTPTSALPKTWEKIDTAIKPLASTTQIYAASIDPKTGACTPIHTLNPTTDVALGSTFKLYILSTLAKQIEAGKYKWSDTIAIEDAKKSLPSGTMQNDPVGTKHTIEHMANKMISVSDNTATDHLLRHVGHKAVEAQLKALKNTAKYNFPFMSTREMFTIKLGLDAAAQTSYANADETTRRTQLAKITKQPLPDLKSASTWSTPRHIDTIEWFASGPAICALHGDMVVNHKKPAHQTALKAMAISDAGLRADKDLWPYVGYKGGSEPGVVHMSFLSQHKDGTWYSLTMALNDTKKPVSVMALFNLIKAGHLLLKK